MKLAEIYEILGETRRALDLVYEVIDSRKKRKAASQQQQQQQQSTPDPSSSAPNAQQQPGSGGGLFPEPKKPLTTTTSTSTTSSAHQRAQNRLTHAQLRELEAEKEREVRRGFGRLRELWGAMLGGGMLGGAGEGLSGGPGSGGGGSGGGGGGSQEGERGRRVGEAGEGGGGGASERDGETRKEMTQEEAERLWILEAEKLVDMFRETRNLFLTSRANPFRGMFPRSGRKKRERQRTEVEEDQMASRLQLDLERDTLARTQKSKQQASDKGVDNFRGVSFDEWLRMIFQYCFVLTKRDQFDLADEILRHILVSNAYQAQERQDAIRIALITCALHAHSHPTIVDQCRKLITRYQFNNEPLRLLLASLSSGLRPTDAFITSTLQKHLFRRPNEPRKAKHDECYANSLFSSPFPYPHRIVSYREMKLADVAVRKPELLKWNALNKRYAYVSGAGKVGGGSKGDSADPDPDPDPDGDEDEDEDEVDVESVAASVSGGERKGGAGSGAGVGVGGAGSGLGGAGSVVGGAGGSGSTGTGSGSTTGGAVGGPPDLPTKQNPVLVAIYGQICIAAKSYQSGIFYLLHAYDYAPHDPMICLCLAIASVGRAMQRQSDNRHHLIAQGMAFLSQYRALRSKSPRTVREVEYNFGRIFHQLGLYSYAVKQYERVLELAERDGDDLYAKEAAYNLSLIYVFTGATPLADKLYRRWLSL
ncbi:hypothetical protein CC1G_02241 [Coprinopsis cinerea okayama7|uniref:Uncharacterized protein n=1 Tax=Coprinopsis cinerea (strain Okayama-7 / 130 / ATCC MYA-4618 / FGSC 9003) TaxID=240176 RepID=A8NKP1_COPC7|nr:hypothetical protein CC1G_02241 [Coprinopsis cinerea okayama7\|eukprot:XP_001834505.2 hypothetical protein CC1G_02241 [Coprinopsis cinerea okayama7\